MRRIHCQYLASSTNTLKQVCTDRSLFSTFFQNNFIISFILIDAGIRVGNRLLYFTQHVLGEGHFGKVIKGVLKGENDSIPVAIKVLKGNSNCKIKGQLKY